MFERQTENLLYPKILWNRPISRATAGRLLLVGGSKGNVASLQGVHQIAGTMGIGALSLLVPDVLRPLLGSLPDIDFGQTTISGSLAQASLGTLQELSNHSDAVLIGPDASNNSETAILFEKFITDYNRDLIIVDDALAVIAQMPDLIRQRPNTLVTLSMQQLFKLAGQLQLPIQIRPDAGITGKVDILKSFWQVLKVDLALIGPEIIIKVGEHASVTTLEAQPANLLSAAAGALSVSYIQNPTARYEGLTTGSFMIKAAITDSSSSISEIANALTKAVKNHEN